MRVILLLTVMLLGGVMAACSDETPADTATPVPTVAPSPTPAPTATSMFVPTATPGATETATTAAPAATPGATSPAPTPLATAMAAPAPTAMPAPTPTPAPVVRQSPPPTETAPEGRPVDGGVLKLLGADPPTLDPHRAGDAVSSGYVLEVFGGLVTIDPNLALVPDLAQDWAVDPDGMGYTFRLNPAATFHDGRKVTATDFQWSLERATDPATESPSADTYLGDIVGALDKLKGAAGSISGISVIDDETLRLETDAPKPYFLSKLTYPTSFVVDRDNVAAGPGWTNSPNGTGPFILAEYQRGGLIRLERFDGYHLGPARVDAVEFNLSGGDGILMYQNDEIHFGAISPLLLEGLADPSNPLYGQWRQGPPAFNVAYIGMNVSEPPFDDRNVRLALNYAIDRDALTQTLLEGAVVSAKGVLPPGFPGYNPNLPGYEYDPDKARQLLAESKYGGDTANYPAITLTLPGAFGAPVSPAMESILTTWEHQLGLRVDLLQTEWATFLDDLQARRFQMFSLGWIADYPDPENFLDLLFHSESSNNHTHYNVPELDALLERARIEPDQQVRFALYQQAERMILDGGPWIPLWHSNGDDYLVKPYVQGLHLSPLLIPRLRYVYFIE